MNRDDLTPADWKRLLRDGGDGLPRCICGEEVAVPHTECIAMYEPVTDSRAGVTRLSFVPLGPNDPTRL